MPQKQTHRARWRMGLHDPRLSMRCPSCKAPVGQWCLSPQGLMAKTLHSVRRRALTPELDELAAALRVIRTWASYDDGRMLDPGDVVALVDKTFKKTGMK